MIDGESETLTKRCLVTALLWAVVMLMMRCIHDNATSSVVPRAAAFA